LSSATFIGWQMGGFWGAMAATAGIFLPSFLFVALLNPLIPKLRQSGIMSAFLDAVNIAAVAVILAVAIAMGREILLDWKTVLIALTSLAVLVLFKKLNSAWIVAGGAALGFVLSMV
jgi:chromate transporter